MDFIGEHSICLSRESQADGQADRKLEWQSRCSPNNKNRQPGRKKTLDDLPAQTAEQGLSPESDRAELGGQIPSHSHRLGASG
jgi:hypothetical protein